MTINTLARGLGVISLLGLMLMPSVSPAQAGTFSYQGQLTDADGPVNGSCDFAFSLWTASSAGTQIGTYAVAGLAVSGGLFTTELDFGAGAFDGDARWLEVTVDCGDGPATLPRQQLTASPYSLTSLSTTGLQGRPVSEAAPAAGEVLAWDGSQWAPSTDADSGGDITAVNAGDGLIGGGETGAVSMAVDRTQIQSRIGGTCPPGSSIRTVNPDGSVVCEPDSIGITGYEWVRASESVSLQVNQCGSVRAECPSQKKLIGVWTGSSNTSIIPTAASTGIRSGTPPRPPTSYLATFCNKCRVGVQVGCGSTPSTATIHIEAICVNE